MNTELSPDNKFIYLKKVKPKKAFKGMIVGNTYNIKELDNYNWLFLSKHIDTLISKKHISIVKQKEPDYKGEIGDEVFSVDTFGNRIELPEGEYTLRDGRKITTDGKVITSIK